MPSSLKRFFSKDVPPMRPVFLAMSCSLLALTPVLAQVAPYDQVLEDGKKQAGGGTGVAPAQSPMRIGDRVYDHLEFITTNGEIVTFESKEGPVTAKWSELPKDVQQYFAQAYADSLKIQQTSVIQDIGLAVKISGRVVKKLDHGVLVSWGGKMVLLTGYPDEAAPANGDQISLTAQRTGLFQYRDASGTNQMVQKYKVAKAQ